MTRDTQNRIGITVLLVLAGFVALMILLPMMGPDKGKSEKNGCVNALVGARGLTYTEASAECDATRNHPR